MDAQQVFTLGQQGLYILMLVSAPVLIVVLLVGVVVSVIQAATQINEATLSFVPKVLTLFASLLVFLPWMLNVLTTFTANLLANIPNYAH